MKLPRWLRFSSEPSPEAQEAVDDARQKLLTENLRAQEAEIIAWRAGFLGRRNHYAEAAVVAMENFRSRP